MATTATKKTTRKPAAKKAEAGAPKLTKEGGVPPEWHMDPERNLGAEELEALHDWEEKGEIKVKPDKLQSHHELIIDFTGIRPETDFELKIDGPISSPYFATLKSDPWGQAQLIWRTPTGGEYKVEAKGPGVSLSADFEVSAYNADAEYRAERRAAAGKGKGKAKAKPATGSVATVEDPSTMEGGDAAPDKNQPTEAELEDASKYDPAYQPAKSETELAEEAEAAAKDKE